MKTFSLILLLFIGSFAIAETVPFRLENGSPIHIMTLENGFTVFLREEQSSALVHTQFACKAGYSSQMPNTTGFFLLYSRLFFGDSSSSLAKTLGAESACLSDSAVYTADVPRQVLEDYLAELSDCAMHPSFSDEAILREHTRIKQDSSYYAASTTGLINTAIDSRVFASAPWKLESGIYPDLFAVQNVAESRAKLLYIKEHYYTPENSALFISGPVTAQQAYALCLAFFSSWQGSATAIPKTPPVTKADKDSRRFVIADDAFSADMTQLVVQYTSLSMGESDILSAAFSSYDSPYIQAELSDPIVAIRSYDYLTGASVHTGSKSRLVLQALLEEPYLFSPNERPESEKDEIPPSPALQTERFLLHIKESSLLSDAQFLGAKEKISARYRKQTGDALESIELLSAFWAIDSENPDGFFQRFTDFPKEAEQVSKENLHRKVSEEEPFVFVLLNTETYKKNEEAFTTAGYSLITKENASWYHTELYALVAPSTEDVAQEDAVEALDKNSDVSFLPSEFFYKRNLSLLSEFSLKNNIPVTLKNTPGSSSVAIGLCISGGECALPTDQGNAFLLRTVLVNALARNCQDVLTALKKERRIAGETSITAKTEQTASFLLLECQADEVTLALQALFSALIYGEIQPFTADRLVSEQKAQRASASLMLDTQLEWNALAYLYRNTPFALWYDQNAKPLENIDLHTISLAYTQLLDASLHSFIIVGGIKGSQAKKILEQTFGLLRAQTERSSKAIELPRPQFKNKTRRVQLRHLYSTNKTPDMAPDGVPLLVPTKNFYDPAHYYFAAPTESLSLSIYNALLYELKERIQKQVPADSSCTAKEASYTVPVGSLRVDQIEKVSQFSRAYSAALSSLQKDLAEDNPALLRKIKNRWQKAYLIGTESNTGTAELIYQGILSGKASLYMENYAGMEKATQDAFLEVLSEYFSAPPTFSVTSVDSKQ